MDRVVVRRPLHSNDDALNRRWWLSRPAHERLAEVERLRRAWYGSVSGF